LIFNPFPNPKGDMYSPPNINPDNMTAYVLDIKVTCDSPG